MNPKSTDQRHPRVVVIGGGYAGVLAANRLQRRADVTLINPRPAFVERIRLHQRVTGNRHIPQCTGDALSCHAIRRYRSRDIYAQPCSGGDHLLAWLHSSKRCP